jgi:hypothetical protein
VQRPHAKGSAKASNQPLDRLSLIDGNRYRDRSVTI